MAYQIIEFDGVALPVQNPTQDHTGASVDSTLQPSIGGMFDYYGATQRRGRQAQYTLTGVYIGDEPAFIVDELSNFFVDELGNFFVTGDEAASLALQVNALRAKIGVRGPLWRYVMGTNALRWVTARLLTVSHQQVSADREIKAELTCTFETAMDAWRAQTQTVTTTPIGVGANTVNIHNGGNVAVNDTVVTITATGTITSVRIECTAAGIDLTWTGSVTAGTTLVIGGGALTIRNNGAEAFAGLVRNGAHTARGWLPLITGVNVWTVTLAGSAGSIWVGHYDQFR